MISGACCRKTVLDNGVRIVTETIPGARSVSAGVWVRVGSRDEEDHEQGISHLVEHMVFKGTRKRSALDIAKEFDILGGLSNAFTGKEHTCFHAKVLDTSLAHAVDLLLDIFTQSRFDSKDLELEKSVVLQEIGLTEDSPEDYIHILFNRAFWNGDPLGRSVLGSREIVAAFDRSQILEYIRRSYVGSNILVAAAGNVEHETFRSLVDDALSAFPASPFPARSTPSPSPRTAVFERRDLEQVHVCLGTKGSSCTDSSRFADALLNIILGGNMSSRLFQEVRENRGLVYNIYSFLNTYEGTGMLGVYLAVPPHLLEEALEVTAREFRRLWGGEVTEEDLDAAKHYLKGSIILGAENTDNRMMRLAKNEFTFSRYVSLEELIQRIDGVTLDELMEIAHLRLELSRVSLAALGPVDAQPSFPV